MNGKSFATFAKDFKLIDTEKLTTKDVDLIFAKIKDNAACRINFTEFQIGLCLLAE